MQRCTIQIGYLFNNFFMKLKNFAGTFLFLSLFLIPSALVFAGGSSVRVRETNVQDKVLKAGGKNQLLMSFKVEPGNISIENFDFHCVPATGMSKIQLMQGEKTISSTKFSSAGGKSKAHFGTSKFVLPKGKETEFKIMVDVNPNTNSYITTCAIDDLTFKDKKTGTLYDAGYQAVDFKGIRTLLYVENTTSDPRDNNFSVIKKWNVAKNLPLNSKNNRIADFEITPQEGELQDIFFYCSDASVIKDMKMSIDGKMIKPTDIQVDAYTSSRPEHSWGKRIVFSNVGKIASGSKPVKLSIYADTYNYFLLADKVWPRCEVLGVKTIKKTKSINQQCDDAKLTVTSPATNVTFNSDLKVKWHYMPYKSACATSHLSHYFIKLEAQNKEGKKIQYGYLIWKDLQAIKNGLEPLGRGPFTEDWGKQFTISFQKKEFSIPSAWFDQNNLRGLKTQVTLFACEKYSEKTSSTCEEGTTFAKSTPLQVIYQ